MESSKKNLGKITPFGERIIKVLKTNNLVKENGDVNYAEAERRCGIKGTGLSKAVMGNSMHDGNLQKFLRTFGVEKDWLLHGRGQMEAAIKDEKHTSVPMQHAMSIKDVSINTLEHTVAGLRYDITQKDAMIAGLRSDLAGLRADIAEVRKERDQLKKQVDELLNRSTTDIKH